jgi:hypothetical protein
MAMKSIVLALILLVGQSSVICCSQPDSHKSESAINQMTPEERVREYCNEHYRDGSLQHAAYLDALFDHLKRDGLKAFPEMTKIINEFDPTRSKNSGRDKDGIAYAAEILLGSLDRFFRVRAFAEGKQAIDAMSREVELMRAAHFDTAPTEGEYSKRYRYEASVGMLQDLKGASDYDMSVQDTLKLRYNIKLSKNELVDFSNYLTSQDPYYPGWSETEWYVDHSQLNDAGNPLQYSIVKDIEPFHKAYLKYKAKPRSN